MAPIYGNSEFVKNKLSSHIIDEGAHEREGRSAKRSKVLLIVLAVSLGFALGVICALSLLYAGCLRDIQERNVSIPADPGNMSFRTETEIDVGIHHRVEEHLASSTDYIRSHSSEPCEDGWTAYDGNCYLVSSEMQTWFDSNLTCGALDAHLVIIETEKEQLFLRSKIKYHHWIGLNDLDTEGRWVWVNNQTLEETGVQFWLKRESVQNEPDNWKGEDSSGEHCAIMRISDQWSDVPCKRNYNFTCEKKQTSSFMHDD